MRSIVSPGLASTVVVLLALTLTACSTTDQNAALPDGVTVDVYQTRTDAPARKLEIAITNAGDEDLTIESAEFVSSQFAEPAVWSAREGGTIVRGGFGVDLPVQLPAPACDDEHPLGTVRLRFTTESGQTGSSELPAVDRYDRLPAMRAEECFAASIDAVAGLSIKTLPRIEQRGGIAVALIDVSAEPTGNPGEIRIEGVHATVLLGIADADGGAVTEAPLDVMIAGTDPPTAFSVPIIPGRCDPHAVAEDKQGTIFIFDALAPDGTSSELRIAATSEVRAAIYEYIATTCGY